MGSSRHGILSPTRECRFADVRVAVSITGGTRFLDFVFQILHERVIIDLRSFISHTFFWSTRKVPSVSHPPG